jgi:hypothetical protein
MELLGLSADRSGGDFVPGAERKKLPVASGVAWLGRRELI